MMSIPRKRESSFLLSYYPGSLKKLPVISPIAVRIAKMSAQKLSEADLVAAFESAVFLAAKIVSIANSIFYNHSHTPCYAVRDALYRVGPDFCCALLRASDYALSSEERVAAQELWLHSMLTASLARELAKAASASSLPGDAMYLIGLTHEIGLLVEGDFERHRFSEVVNGHELREQEDDLHCILGESLLRYWALPPLISRITALHHDRRPHACGEASIEIALVLLNIAHSVMSSRNLPNSFASDVDEEVLQRAEIDLAALQRASRESVELEQRLRRLCF